MRDGRAAYTKLSDWSIHAKSINLTIYVSLDTFGGPHTLTHTASVGEHVRATEKFRARLVIVWPKQRMGHVRSTCRRIKTADNNALVTLPPNQPCPTPRRKV